MRYSFILLLCLVVIRLSAQPVSYKDEIKGYRSRNWAGLISDPRTTLQPKDSIHLHYFPIKESNKVFCSVELLKDQQPIEMPTYSGQVKVFKRYALLHFTWKGKPMTLSAYQNLQLTSPLYSNHLFLPVKDLTSGKQTYEGGRYLDIRSTSIQNNKILLDLNQLYNPWCAYSDGYNCPIPPAENHLMTKLKVGEKKFRKPH